MSKKNIKEEKEVKLKCDECKKKSVTFFIHECKKSIQECLGCPKCDDWCTKCNPEWNNHDSKK